MKKLSLVTRISIGIFLVIMTVTLLLAIPVYRRLETIIDRYAGKLGSEFTGSTGLTLSYDSISPSILANLGIKNIKVLDSSGKQLAGIKTVHIKYRFIALLKGEFDSIVRGVVADGVEADIQALSDFIQKMVLEKSGAPPQGEEKPPFDETELYNQVSMIMDYIPPNISVKNAVMKYDDDALNASLMVREIRVLNTRDKKAVDFNIKSNMNVKYSNVVNTKGDVALSGTITSALDDSFANITLSNFSQDKYKLNKLNFLLSYNKRQFLLRTVQNVFPMNVRFAYDLNNNIMEASVQTENLNPISVLSSGADKKLLSILRDTSLTLSVNLFCNVSTQALRYSSGGSILVPDGLIPGTANINYSLTGNDSGIIVEKFNVEGQNCSADVELSFIYKTLQLSGIADLRQYILPNGTPVSTEIYFDPLASSGFMLFSPQVYIGDKSLTAMQARVMPQADSIDFDFEINDYSHMDQDAQGIIKADGSFLTASNYLQTSLSLESIYLDTILGIAKQVLPPEQAQPVENASAMAANYVFSGDAYFSTDLKSMSYNIPYLVLANTVKDDQLFLVAINGNEQSIQLNRFNMIYGPVALEATASLDSMPDSPDKFYTVDIISSSIPYHFSGTIMPEVVTLSGDYGMDAELRMGKDKKLGGYAYCTGIPFVAGNSTYIFSVNTDFEYNEQQGPEVNLTHFQIEKDSPDTSINPRLEISGSGTRYGAQINSIAYTDLYSSLRGNSDITINIDNGLFSSAGVQMNLKDSMTEERVVIDAAVSNPDAIPLTSDNIFNSLYLNVMAEISNFSLNRFLNVRNDNNELNASLYVSGTLEHPYATASIQKLTLLVEKDIISSSGSVVLEERELSLNDFVVNGNNWNVTDITGNASLDDFSGQFNALFTVPGEKSIVMPLTLSVGEAYLAEDSLIPLTFTAKLSCPGMSGTLFKNPVPFDISVNYTKDFISFYTSDNFGVFGTFSSADGLFASWRMGDIVSTDITGQFNKNDMLIRMSNININLPKLLQNLTLDDVITVEQGIVKGSGSMRGGFDTPDFKGAVSISNPVFQLPFLFNQKISTEKILITASNNEFTVSESVYKLKNTPKFKMNSHTYLNKWTVDHFDMGISTLENQTVPLKFKSPLLKVDGETECNMNVVFENNNLDLTGNVFVENLNIVSNITELSNGNMQSASNAEPINVTTDLKLKLGTHSSLNFDPLLRCVFVPHTNITCKIDTSVNMYQLDGQLQLKSGDVAYLNRSFYIKEGNIKFNPSDIANPLVTIRAETRERDSQGQTVRIILSAENQYLLDFNPRFSSVPPKSENEIRLLMGQIVLADSDSVGDFFLSAGDYYLQSTVARGIENKLRDLLNFDIFSVRTNILQNTVNMSTQRNKTKEVSIGNFFDNSTVYIGKYIGSALYVDAMLNMSAPDYMDTDYLSTGKLLFQPEFGLELELPVMNIRWDMAWDLTPGLKFKSYVPDTSLSLSWKFTF